MHGFKEDFDAWRQSLTEDERQLMKRQTMGEYNRKYRKSEEFSKELPEEKQQALTTILQRYIENEMEEDKKKTTKGNTLIMMVCLGNPTARETSRIYSST